MVFKPEVAGLPCMEPHFSHLMWCQYWFTGSCWSCWLVCWFAGAASTGLLVLVELLAGLLGCWFTLCVGDAGWMQVKLTVSQ